MATLIVRLKEEAYVRWSNTTDAPVSHVMTRDDILKRPRSEDELDPDEALRLVKEADATGTSDPTVDLDALLAANRAGTDESHLTVSEILRQYQQG